MNFDFIRLFLASVVMLNHYGIETSKLMNWINPGTAVSAFFCISGFLITQSYLSTKNFENYIKKRLARIYPPIFVVLIAMIILGIYYKFPTSYMVSASQMLLFENISPIDENKIYSHGAFWTLVVEFQFYLILPLIILFLRKWQLWAKILLVGLYFLSNFMSAQATENLIMRSSIFIHLNFFLAGIFLAFTWHKFSYHQKITLLIFSSIFYILHFPSSFPLLLAIIIIFSADLLGKALRNKKCFFGDISYGVYIYHYPIREIMLTNGTYVVTSTIFVVIITSFISWHFIEKQILNFSKNLIKKKERKELAFEGVSYSVMND